MSAGTRSAPASEHEKFIRSRYVKLRLYIHRLTEKVDGKCVLYLKFVDYLQNTCIEIYRAVLGNFSLRISRDSGRLRDPVRKRSPI